MSNRLTPSTISRITDAIIADVAVEKIPGAVPRGRSARLTIIVRWSLPCEPIENDPIAEVDPLHVVVDASLLAGALIDAEGPIGRRYRRRLSDLVDGDQACVLRTLTKLEVAAALRNQLQRGQRGDDGSGSTTRDDCERPNRLRGPEMCRGRAHDQ